MPTQVFILPGASKCDNLGDLAMLQVALERIKTLWPEAVLSVLTRDPDALREHCPGVEAVPWKGRNRWLQCPALPGIWFPKIPGEIRRRFPMTPTHGWRFAWLLASGRRQIVEQFSEALFRSNLVVLSGCGLLADPFAHNARQMLDTLAAAQRADISTALLSQGLGPMTDSALRQHAAQVLSRAGRIFLRESRASGALLRAVGVSEGRVCVTGDDTVELAFRERRTELGIHLGVNLRMATYSAVDEVALTAVRKVLAAVVRARKVRLLGLPITRQNEDSDVQTVGRLLTDFPASTAHTGDDLATPLHVIRQTGHCRLVLTGSYHAGVFALAQGIPVVALAASLYYANKFRGLADQFAGGCEVLNPGEPDFAVMLEEAVNSLWVQAPELRPQLLAAAERQVRTAQAAYAELRSLISESS